MPGELHLDWFSEDHLVERDGDVWVASVPCFCGTGACPPSPTEWHWHEVVRAETLNDLIVLLAARQVIDSAAEAA
jgi:hypothetical protein